MTTEIQKFMLRAKHDELCLGYLEIFQPEESLFGRSDID